MNQTPYPNLPINTAIVVLGVFAMLVIGGYAYKSSKGEALEPPDARQQPHHGDRS